MSAASSPSRPAPRWGLGDVVWVWFAGLAVGTIVAVITAAARGRGAELDPDGLDLAIGLFAQNGAILVALVWVSRVKGLGRLRRDFGLVVRLGDWPWLAAGVLVQVLSVGVIEVLRAVADGLPEQQAVDTLDQSKGPDIILIVIAVALFGPVVEELLFRGLLLRALLRRTTAVGAVVISSIVFAVVHLLDPNTATLMAPLLLLAVIAGIRAVRTGDLSQSIMLHVGFNLLAAVFLSAS